MLELAVLSGTIGRTMNRIAFKKLLQKYLDGTTNTNETALIESWYELLNNDYITPISAEELASMEEEIWEKIVSKSNITPINNATSYKNIRFIKKYVYWMAAAIIFGIIATSYLLSKNSSHNQPLTFSENVKQSGLIETANTSNTVLKIKLEDGSYVVLQPNSKIAYPKHFANDKREVFMEGDAFFKVAKNASMPFFVYNQNLVTQVLGTSFIVKTDKFNKQVTVEVKSGKVTVFENNKAITQNNIQTKSNGAIITPNQTCIYNIKERYFVTALSENPEPVVFEDTSSRIFFNFLYEDVKLSDILKTLSMAYAIEIETENEYINACKFTGDLATLSLYDKLELICLSTNNTYEIKGTKILLKGKGCK
jgi:hypothetical protein